MSADLTAKDFFGRYAKALFARDPKAIAALYAVPALIEFPENRFVVTDAADTEAFFASAIGQYDGVGRAEHEVTVVAGADHSVWADVTWHYDTLPPERFIYQLVSVDGDWKIGVLTPLAF